MARRPYDMSKRKTSAAETRRLIVVAAVRVYAREGFKNASFQAIAREADVSATTVLNHFATPDELITATVEILLGEIGVPRLADLQALATREERITRLARDLVACFERSGCWYSIYSREKDVPALQKASEQFFRDVDELIRAALGPGARDKRTIGVARTLLGPGTISALRASGMTGRAAAEVVAELLTSWLGREKR